MRPTVSGNRLMIELRNIDLRTDAAARRVVKDETVTVNFADRDGELMSLEGPNRYVSGDALITGSTGDRWVVSRERFDAKYVPARDGLAHGVAGPYRNRPAIVLAKRMDEAFSLARSEGGGDVLNGTAGDWIMQYAPGDYGVVQAARFAKVYRLARDK
ncbi:PGDYG protein [Paraburkholderia megapolitana]|uniref:PGDYG protein n=2 Tax=Burkholderiaceae TaxID=119060 RepID=A0A1I3MZ68_9BURK|nr:PGDYG protein [Paraburkholderia megapolitana]